MKDYNHLSRLLGWFALAAMPAASFAIALAYGQFNLNLLNFNLAVEAQSLPTLDILPEAKNGIYQMFKSTTVRVIKANSAGSGVIIDHQENVYSVLTNWHVVSSNVKSSKAMILTVDDEQHQLAEAPRQIGNADLALLKFYSEAEYPVAQVQPIMPKIGDQVYAAGFPLIINQANSLNWGNEAFRLTHGQISIIPDKSMPQGYQLGYSNNTEIGMSGSPIFDEDGALIAIHGRGKYRDPGFGVYLFEDGSEPSPEQLKKMIESSWGIPLGAYKELLH
jgi:serine protease Do